MLSDVRNEIAELVSDAEKINAEEVLPTIEIPRGGFGDLSSRISFVLAPVKKENPAVIAKRIAGKISGKSRNFERIEASGPYINFFFSKKLYSGLLKDAVSGKWGFRKKKGRIVVEYPSVNPNKPWHIGHLRNAILGGAVSAVLSFSGRKVERLDYINDLGLQVAQSLWGCLNLSSKAEGKFDVWLGKQYVEVAKRFEEDASVEKEVRALVKELEQGGKAAKKGRELTEKCVKAQYETAFSYEIYHDVLVLESDLMHTIFDEGLRQIKRNRAVKKAEKGKNAGCWVVVLSEELKREFGELKEPSKVLIRSDGTATYTGKDIIYHLWKFGKLKKNMKFSRFVKQPDGSYAFISSAGGRPMDFGNAARIINIIGVEQKFPQRVVSDILRNLNYRKESENYVHLAYEHVSLPEEKFSGRKGTWLGYTADELLEEAKKRVLEKIKLDVSEKEKEKIAGTVAVGAIKFSILRSGAEKRIIFNWDDVLSMEGDSGPYAQYAYVRTRGILGKANEKPSVSCRDFNDDEKALIKTLCSFPDVVERSAAELSPHYIAKYCLDVSVAFTRFYGSSPVLKEKDAKKRKTRLAIVSATGNVLKDALSLLGISCPEKM